MTDDIYNKKKLLIKRMTGIKVIDEENEVDVGNYHKDERNDDEEKLDLNINLNNTKGVRHPHH